MALESEKSKQMRVVGKTRKSYFKRQINVEEIYYSLLVRRNSVNRILK